MYRQCSTIINLECNRVTIQIVSVVAELYDSVIADSEFDYIIHVQLQILQLYREFATT
jgi:hypothetical protein